MGLVARGHHFQATSALAMAMPSIFRLFLNISQTCNISIGDAC